jgi:hypothetical protein
MSEITSVGETSPAISDAPVSAAPVTGSETVSGSLLGNAAAAPPSWMSGLPDDLRNEKGLSKFKDIGGLAKSYLSAEKVVTSSIRIPGESASPEEKAAFYEKLGNVQGIVKLPEEGDTKGLEDLYTRLGRPESPSAYKVELATGETIESPEIANLLQAAHGAGLNQNQVQAVLGVYNGIMERFVEQSQVAKDEAYQTLKKEWGSNFDDNLSAANVALKAYHEKFPKEMEKLTSDPHTSNNPAILALFAELGSRMGEGRSIDSNVKGSFQGEKESALAKIAEIQSSGRDHPYWNERLPGHRQAVAEMDKLYKKAYGS